MRIIRIRIRNLASFEGEHVIDFTEEPLRSSGLFTIVGPTGSGKSTCLDALSLSLYGTSPRFRDATKVVVYAEAGENNGELQATNDPRNILRKGCKECLAETAFMGQDGQPYLASWSASYYKSKKPQRRLENLQTHHVWIASQNRDRPNADELELRKQIERVVGLDYEQFTRTVMLAQNSFANFLKADGADKGRLLEKLTGTEIYSRVSQKIYERYRQMTDAVKELEMEQASFRLHLMDEETFNNRNEEQAALKKQLDEMAKERENLQSKQRWYAREREIKDQIRLQALQLETAEKNMAAHEEDAKRLAQWDAIQEIYPQCIQARSYADQLKQEQSTREMLLKEQAEGQKCVEQMRIEAGQLQRQLDDALEVQEKMKPQWAEYRTSYGEWKQKVVQHHELQRKLKDDQQMVANLSRQLAEVEKRLAELISRKKLFTEEFESFRMEPSFVDRIPAIVSDLQRLAILCRQYEDTEKQCANLEKKILPDLASRLDKSVSESQLLKGRYEEQSLKLQHLRVKVNPEDTQILQREGEKYTQIRQHLDESLGLWNKLAENARQLCDLQKQKHGLETEKQKCADKEQQLQKDVERLTAVTEGMKEAYHLSVAQNVGLLRRQLVENAPCPVCGSLHHPYVADERAYEQAIAAMRQAMDDKVKTLDGLKKKLDEVRSEQARIKGVSQMQVQNMQRLSVQQSELAAQWHEETDRLCELPDSFECDESVWSEGIMKHEEEKRKLDQQIVLWRDRWQKHALMLEDYRILSEKVQKSANELSRMEQDIARLRIEAGKADQQLQQAAARMKELLTEKTILEEQLDVALHGVDENWKMVWKTDPAGYDDRLEKRRLRYRQVTDALNRLLVETGKLQTEADNLGKELQGREAELKKESERDGQVSQEVNRLDMVLKKMFDGKTADEAEQESNRKVAEIRRNYESCQQSGEKLRQKLSEDEGRLHQSQEKTEGLCRHLQVAENAVKEWLERYGQTHDAMSREALECLTNESRDWDGLRQMMTALRRNVDTSRSVYDALLKTEKTHCEQQPQETEPQLAEALSASAVHMEETDKRLSEISALLALHHKALKELGSKEKQYRETVELTDKWKLLNTVFGTADGNRYREKAQCFTLAILVEHANEQLRQLTSRYALAQIPDSLGLKIIDHDRGDEERAISTLSGGETFLVSLSLALGLSALSCKKMRIGTLFVDEGFGTLDAQSLVIVIEALSRLQSAQGRQVGVISHTEEMRNSIPTRIQIVKESTGGKSHIEIYPRQKS